MNKSQFFKYLSSGGAVRLITLHNEPVPADHPRGLGKVRKAIKVQSNAIKFDNGSWLYKDEVEASKVHDVFAGGDKPAVSVGWAVYQLVEGE